MKTIWICCVYRHFGRCWTSCLHRSDQNSVFFCVAFWIMYHLQRPDIIESNVLGLQVPESRNSYKNKRERSVSVRAGRRVGSGQNRKSSSARFKVEGFGRRVGSLYRLHFLLLHSFTRMLSSEGVLTWTRTQTREHDEAKAPKTHFHPQNPPLCQFTLNDTGEEDGGGNQVEVILF